MWAIVRNLASPSGEVGALSLVQRKKPSATGRDLLIAPKAVAINPIDAKVSWPLPDNQSGQRILGFDASGVVLEVGADVTSYEPGDEVYYAGDITREGSFAEYQLVDERLVGPKPKTLSYPEAAAMPLTSLTAHEALFEHLGIASTEQMSGDPILLVGGAGGVNSMAIQLARAAGRIVIATASRQASADWVRDLGADIVVDHSGDLAIAVRAEGINSVDCIALFHDLSHWDSAIKLLAPRGRVVSIDDSDIPLKMDGLKEKSASLHWEFVFVRPKSRGPDMARHGQILNEVAAMVDAGQIRSTLHGRVLPLEVPNLSKALTEIGKGRTVGKTVFETSWTG